MAYKLKRSRSGFGNMKDKDKQREIAAKGGRAAHQKGTAHEFTTEEAVAAGRKGGLKVAANIEHMREIGKKGGKKRAENMAAKVNQENREMVSATMFDKENVNG